MQQQRRVELQLKDYLKRQNLTISAFARRAGITVSTVHRVASGEVKPSTETLNRIVAASQGEVQPNDFYERSFRQSDSQPSRSMEANAKGMRIGIDIGGTFTDLIMLDGHGANGRVEKVPTTPENLALGVLAGLDRFRISGESCETIIHGTTVGLNAFLEKKGAPTGLITTKGFRDVYEIGRHNRVETCRSL